MYGVIDSVARKIKKVYGAIGSVTKKVSKIYAVVNGVTRLIFSSEVKASKYGTASSGLSSARYQLSGASVGDYAIFAGGALTYPVQTVDAYNSSLTKNSSISALPNYTSDAGAASIGNYALFAGGVTFDGYSTRSSQAYVIKYDISLTRGYASSLSTARDNMAEGNVGEYAVFYGGREYNDSAPGESVCDIYNASLTKQYKYLAYALYRFGKGSANVGDYIVFPGGRNYSSGVQRQITFLNSSLTYDYSSQTLPTGVCGWAAGHTQDYAILTGGLPPSSNSASTQVIAWNSSLTQSVLTSLSYAKCDHACASLNGIVIVGGGFSGGTYVDSYDNSLTKTALTATSVTHAYCAAATAGIYALFAGSSSSTTVDVYQVK